MSYEQTKKAELTRSNETWIREPQRKLMWVYQSPVETHHQRRWLSLSLYFFFFLCPLQDRREKTFAGISTFPVSFKEEAEGEKRRGEKYINESYRPPGHSKNDSMNEWQWVGLVSPSLLNQIHLKRQQVADQKSQEQTHTHSLALPYIRLYADSQGPSIKSKARTDSAQLVSVTLSLSLSLSPSHLLQYLFCLPCCAWLPCLEFTPAFCLSTSICLHFFIWKYNKRRWNCENVVATSTTSQ